MTTGLTLEEWDAQFARQAGWTMGTRSHLYRRANLLRAERVLDVGSGTGVVTEDMAARTRGHVTGIDLDPAMVDFARRRKGQADYRVGDAHELSFQDGWFDVVACHFVLMWCRDASRAVQEMMRVTKPGGTVLICAEPDYGGRIDNPDLPLRQWQSEALRREGADPWTGRKLRALLASPAIRQVAVGVISGLWDAPRLRAEFDAEWGLWERSYAGLVAPAELARVKALDLEAVERGERLAYLPVFYALAKV